MKKPILVIMAAGMGSRFGGLKQMTPIDAQGHFIMDYSIFDAIRAGFGKVICVIKKELEADFEAIVGTRIRPFVELVYVYQSIDMVPDGYVIPEGRTKPWGTGHAVLAAAPALDAPFAVINADDFYGREAFESIAKFLTADRKDTEHCMVGYALKNTLTENGTVSRGVCTVDEKGLLANIVERTKILRLPDGQTAFTEDGGETYEALPEDTTVSMNCWGFQAEMLPKLQSLFAQFLQENVPSNPLKAEFYLPSIADHLLQSGTGSVQVIACDARWYGVTYREDLEGVVAAMAAKKAAGEYPEYLWK